MLAFNYTALKYFSQLIATGRNKNKNKTKNTKHHLIFETDSCRKSMSSADSISLLHSVI